MTTEIQNRQRNTDDNETLGNWKKTQPKGIVSPNVTSFHGILVSPLQSAFWGLFKKIHTMRIFGKNADPFICSLDFMPLSLISSKVTSLCYFFRSLCALSLSSSKPIFWLYFSSYYLNILELMTSSDYVFYPCNNVELLLPLNFR